MALSNKQRQAKNRAAHPGREKVRQVDKRKRNGSNHGKVANGKCTGPGPHSGPVQLHHTGYQTSGKGKMLCRACHLRAEGGAFK